jgi:outer membrane protein TolC
MLCHFRLWLILSVLLLGRNVRAESIPATSSSTLSLPQAIALAIQNNLTTRLAQAETEKARGQVLQAAALLLPHVLGTIGQTRQFKFNLEAEGFTPAVLPINPLLGPYNVFDARLQLAQSLLDFNTIWLARAAREGVKVIDFQVELAKEQVATAASLAYLEALRNDLAVQAAQADVELAQSLLRLANDQLKAGLSTGVDQARAETRLSQENLRLIRAQVDARNATLRLKRVVSLPLAPAVTLIDVLSGAPVTLPAVEGAISAAQEDRPETRIAEAAWRADRFAWYAARSQRLPSIEAKGDYGFSGNLPSGSARTGSIGGQLSLPIFYGGAITGQVRQAEGNLHESEARRQDTRAQVEEDVRLALQTLTAEIQEVHTARQSVALADRELKLARDRFSSGVGDNIQVIEAETALAQARDAQVDALARYNTARVNLASSLGQMQGFEL